MGLVLQPRQMATAEDHDLLYHPSGSIIQVLQIGTGDSIGVLRGHMDTVHACVFNPALQEVYSGGNDCQILAWSAPDHDTAADHDAWSDSDNEF